MNTQINLRLPDRMIVSAKGYAEEHGFGTVQEFIKELVREKLFDELVLSREELSLVTKLAAASEEKGLYRTEKELFRKLKRK
jgi:hypothetical protein